MNRKETGSELPNEREAAVGVRGPPRGASPIDGEVLFIAIVRKTPTSFSTK